jgi:hypothetical protein
MQDLRMVEAFFLKCFTICKNCSIFYYSLRKVHQDKINKSVFFYFGNRLKIFSLNIKYLKFSNIYVDKMLTQNLV